MCVSGKHIPVIAISSSIAIMKSTIMYRIFSFLSFVRSITTTTTTTTQSQRILLTGGVTALVSIYHCLVFLLDYQGSHQKITSMTTTMMTTTSQYNYK